MRAWLLLLAGLLVVSGCGFKDIDKRFFVVAVGVDQGKNKKYEISLKLAIPTAVIEPGKSNFELVSFESDSVSMAIRKMKTMVDKEFDFSHAKVIIVGEAVARKDIVESLDWAFRRRDIQRISNLAVGVPNAKSILNITEKSERLAGNSLFLSLGKDGVESAYTSQNYMFDFYARLYEPGLDPYLPVLTKIGKDKFKIDRTALFDKKKLKLMLKPNETRLFNSLMNLSSSNVEVRVDTEEIQYTLSTQYVKTKFKVQGDAIVVKANMKGIAEESNQSLSNREWGTYEKQTAQAYRKKLLKLLKKLQSSKVDPIGFGSAYLASHYQGGRDWERWQLKYPEMSFDVKVKVTLEGTGIVR